MKKILLVLTLFLFIGNPAFAADEEAESKSPAQVAAENANETANEAKKALEEAQKSLDGVASEGSGTALGDMIEDRRYLQEQQAKGALTSIQQKRLTELNEEISKQKAAGTSQADFDAAVTNYQTTQKTYEEAKTTQNSANAEYQKEVSAQQQAEAKQKLDELASDSGTFDISLVTVGGEGSLTLDSTSSSDNNLIQRILGYMITLSGTFGVLMLIVGGFFMVTSEGDDNRLQKGKNIFLYTILGIVVIFVSYIIVQFVISVLFS